MTALGRGREPPADLPRDAAPADQVLLIDTFGVGFVCSQPSATTKTVCLRNEYVFETFYTLQLAPTTRLQADL